MLKKPITTILFQPQDISLLVLFRIAFGLMMFFQLIFMLEYFDLFNIPAYNRISDFSASNLFQIKFYGFEWVQPLPQDWMFSVLLHLMALSMLCVAIGLFYRFSLIFFLISWLYITLIDQSYFQLTMWLYTLITFLLIFIPANAFLSFDSIFNEKIKKDWIPAWCYWILREQIGIVYFAAAFFKMYPDWLHGAPLHIWLTHSDSITNLPIIGELFREKWMAILLSYISIVLELIIIPGLLWKKSRKLAFVFIALFAIFNILLFEHRLTTIPYIAAFATIIFIEPDTPRKVFCTLVSFLSKYKKQVVTDFPLNIGTSISKTISSPQPTYYSRVTILCLSFYLITTLFIAFRYLLYPQHFSWAENGYTFSWAMMSHHKICPRSLFLVKNPSTNEQWFVDPIPLLLDQRQIQRWSNSPYPHYILKRKVGRISSYPEAALQFANFLKNRIIQEKGSNYKNLEVYANIQCSLNGRPFQLFIDPAVNLAKQKNNLSPKSWIVPLTAQLK